MEVAHDAVTLLGTDHLRIQHLFHQLSLATSTNAVENQRDLAQRIVRELSVHAAVEEQVLYPAVRRHLEDGDHVADRSLEVHAEVKHLLVAFDRLRPGDDDFIPALTRLAETVGRHIADDEQTLLPRLAHEMTPEQLAELGHAVHRTKTMAPTRPRACAPVGRPANVLTGALLSMADRGHDGMRHRAGA